MDFISFICPNSSSERNRNGFSTCFNNMVLGFGTSVVTLILVLVLGITAKKVRVNGRINFSEKVFLYFLPVFGACFPCLELVSFLKRELNGDVIPYDVWLFRCSQFAVWTTIVLLSKFAYYRSILLNRVLCLWWIVKPLIGILHLQKTFSSLEAMNFVKESCVVLLDIMFGISMNVVRINQTSSKNSSLEDAFFPVEMDVEEGYTHCENAQDWWNTLTFGSISSAMQHGVTKQLDFEDLLSLPTDMDPSSCHDKLSSSWEAQQSDYCTNPSFLRAIFHAYGWPYFCLGILKVFNDCIGFAGPLLLNKLIRFLEQGSGHWFGFVLAISLGLTSILKSFLDTQYTFHLSKLKLRLRASIMTVIYKKCLCVSVAERSKFSEGEIQTFMSVDTDRTVNMCNSFHDLWSLPLQIGVALYLLFTQVQFAFVSGLTITILLIPVNKWISELIASATEKMMTQKDERIRRTGELLTHVRTLKIYGWELLFAGWLKETRSLEVKHLATRKYLDAWCVFFWATTPTLFSLFTFGLFTLMGHQLDAATVFTCLALFNSLISPLNSFPWVINGLIDAFISARRLSRFLSCFEHKPLDPNLISEDMAVFIHDACGAWSSCNKEEQDLILNHVTLGLPKRSFVVVIGEVGSGKSSLLNLALGEMRLVQGSLYTSGSVAYVPQVPWVLSGTIRDNILFGRSYDSKRYSDTLKACALDVDISLMAGGDMAHVGEKGVNLSGGQRARLTFARAIYHDADVYMLDDVLSAVDAQVGQWVLHNAIQGPLMKKKTRVLCTHNVQAISSADIVVIMEKGHLKWVGSSANLTDYVHSALSSLNEFDTPSHVQTQDCRGRTSAEAKRSLQVENDDIIVSSEAQDIIDVEQRKEGKVELIVYKYYAAFSGWFVTAVIILSAILMQASRNGNDLWLSYWVDTTESTQTEHSTFFYLVVLCIFCTINSFLTLVRAFAFAFGGLHAAVHVHDTLLSRLISAPVQFFDQTPSGRILNRFSSDVYTIDDSLPFILNILLANFVGLLGIAIVLSFVQVFFLLLLLPFWYIYSKLQFFYRSTSRELRRLDSVARSPIYACFTETIAGSSTIRAFKSEGYFLSRFNKHVTLYQQTSYSEITSGLWLSLRLQLLGALIISFVAMMAVTGCQENLPISFGTPGLVGLALSYAAPIVSLLGSFLTSFTETEKEMVSIERALQYMDVPQENIYGCQSLDPNWPVQGQIEFQNVIMRYMPSLPPALNDITFTIEGGKQVGIVGRTGAGKSSILNALFRLNPICSGQILVDGVNIGDVPIRDLRAQLAVVPQSPFLFEGSLRDNLDPLQMSDNIKIWNILDKCHVKEEVEEAGGLDVHVKESGGLFSVGQRQLLCLARALIKCSKVLCLDECTASVDNQTSSILHNTISHECKGMTVITIAHRISTVLNMDNIFILGHGILVEQGNPQVLLQDEFSIFSAFAKASMM